MRAAGAGHARWAAMTERGKPMSRRLVRPVLRAGYGARRLYRAIVRPVTLGVRAIVTDAAGRVLLVRHTYTPGWYLPGGGVARAETVPDAAVRELLEEAGVRALGPPRLVGIYANFLQSTFDHIAVYDVAEWEPAGPPLHLGIEIAEVGFFDPQALPDDISPGTRLRLEEYWGRRRPGAHW